MGYEALCRLTQVSRALIHSTATGTLHCEAAVPGERRLLVGLARRLGEWPGDRVQRALVALGFSPGGRRIAVDSVRPSSILGRCGMGCIAENGCSVWMRKFERMAAERLIPP